MATTVGVLDRECPRCGAPPGIKCRDLTRPKKTAARPHIARGWLDRRCPTCGAQPAERCASPSGRTARVPHKARWTAPRLPGEVHGYARLSRGEPDTIAQQHAALSEAGCVRIWTDRPAGLRKDTAPRRGVQLTELLSYLRREDVLVVWRLDRLAGTLLELAQLAGELHQRAIALRSLSDGLDSTQPGGQQLFAAITTLAALDRHTSIPGSSHTGRSTRARGGRPPLLSPDAHQQIRALYDAGQHTIDELAAAHSVSRPTIYRSLQHTRNSHNQ